MYLCQSACRQLRSANCDEWPLLLSLMIGSQGCAYYARKFNDYAMLHCPRNGPIMLKNVPIMLKKVPIMLKVRSQLLIIASFGTTTYQNHQLFARELTYFACWSDRACWQNSTVALCGSYQQLTNASWPPVSVLAQSGIADRFLPN